MIKFPQFNNLENLGNFIISKNYQILWVFKYFKKIIIKNKFINKIIERLIFRYFNIRNFKIPEYESFYISSFQILYSIQFFNYENFMNF